jgi:hypothetical protein
MPSGEDLARSTFTAVMDARKEVAELAKSVKSTEGGVLFLDAKVDRKFDRLEATLDEHGNRISALESQAPVSGHVDTSYPRASQSGHHLTVEASEYVRVGEEKIMAVRERDSLRVAVASEQRARELAEARAEGAEGAAKKLTERIKLWVAVLGAVALVGGSIWTLAVLTHPPTPSQSAHP